MKPCNCSNHIVQSFVLFFCFLKGSRERCAEWQLDWCVFLKMWVLCGQRQFQGEKKNRKGEEKDTHTNYAP